MATKAKKEPKLYPVADMPRYAEAMKLGFKDSMYAKMKCRVVRTGEYREPKKGEWFLSGAIPEGYRAANDLPSKYHICRLVRVETKHVIVETIVAE
jgi:hypothetical protein